MDLLDRLEALRAELAVPLHPESDTPHDHDIETGRYLAWTALNAILADERKRREPVQMSCPECCKVTPCVESVQMLCTVCSSGFQTPAQLDADLDAVRKARGMPAVKHKLSVAVQEGYDRGSLVVPGEEGPTPDEVRRAVELLQRHSVPDSTPDPRDALLAQARGALDNWLDREGWAPKYVHAAIAALYAWKERKV